MLISGHLGIRRLLEDLTAIPKDDMFMFSRIKLGDS